MWSGHSCPLACSTAKPAGKSARSASALRHTSFYQAIARSSFSEGKRSLHDARKVAGSSSEA